MAVSILPSVAADYGLDSSLGYKYSPGSAQFSPSLPVSDSGAPQKPAVVVNHKSPVSLGELGFWHEARAGLPPSPSVGGQPGLTKQLGWTDGFRKATGKLHNRFTGRTVVVQNMGVHPPVGNVGLSTRSQRLRNRVEALRTDYTPAPATVANSFIGG